MSRSPRARRLTMLTAALAVGMIASACFGGNPAGSNPAGSNPAGSNQLPYWGGKPPDKNVVLPQLPTPASMPPGTPDQAAAALATQIAAGDAGSLPAILAGLQASGIGIRDGTGGVLIQPAQPSQGFAIDNEQAIALGMAATNPTEMTLAELATTLSIGIPDLKGAPTASLILDGIRTRAGDQTPTTRFWAHLLIELGKLPRYGNDPYDLTSAALDPASTYLDMVQVELILFRLDADLVGMRDQLKAGTALVPAKWPGAIAVVYAADAAGSGPCNMSESESQIMDIAAATSMKGFDKVMEYLKEAESLSAADKALAAKVASFTGMANAVFTFGKLVMYYAALHVDISMSGSGPLKRTKKSGLPSVAAGEQRQLTAHAFFDAKNMQMINCFRIMLNVLGMDLSGPSDGNLANSDAQWRLVKGGFSGNSTANQLVEFYNASRTYSGGDPLHQKTNEQGIATIGIEGYPQKHTFPDTARPVVPNKDAEVWLTVQPKPVTFKQDAIDAGAARAGGIVGALLTVPAEMLLRSNLLKPAELPFKVVDWELAFKITIQWTSTQRGRSWSGTITGTVASDPTNTFLDGQGTSQQHLFVEYKTCGPVKDWGPVTVPVTLKAVDKGDGSFELQGDGSPEFLSDSSDTGGFTTIGTFPAKGGDGSGTTSYSDPCGTIVTTFEIQADPAP